LLHQTNKNNRSGSSTSTSLSPINVASFSNSPSSTPHATAAANSSPSSSEKTSQTKSKYTSNNVIVVTKTSPIVAAALSNDEEEDFLLSKLESEKAKKSILQSHTKPEMNDDNKHQIIKHVHDSMDNLRNELLHKGMNKYADDVDVINKNLEIDRKKQEEIERLKREQEQIRIEKVSKLNSNY
jgi:hypothetical protein